MILLVFVIQCLVYKEVTALFDLSFSEILSTAQRREPILMHLSNIAENDTTESNTEAGDQWSKTLNWYFFVVSNYFLYGESIIYYFKVRLGSSTVPPTQPRLISSSIPAHRLCRCLLLALCAES